MNIEKIREVFSDAFFVQSLFEMETVAEVQQALKEKGLERTEQEILATRDLLIKVERGEISREKLENCCRQIERGELSDEMLDQVAGGSLLAAVGLIAVSIGAIMLPFGILDAVDRRW